MKVRVEKAFQDRFSELLNRHTRVVPSFDNELDGELDDALGDLAGGLIEDQSEVVLLNVQRIYQSQTRN